MDFRYRTTPSREFESYTPNELALKRLTLDDRAWELELERLLGKPVHGMHLDLYYRHYINEKFPLPRADPLDFMTYVIDEEKKKVATMYSDFTRAWHASKPEGQRHFAYPSMDYKDQPDAFPLHR